MKIYADWRYIFLTLTLYGDEWSASLPGYFIPRE
jgi:hypothetical protein